MLQGYLQFSPLRFHSQSTKIIGPDARHGRRKMGRKMLLNFLNGLEQRPICAPAIVCWFRRAGLHGEEFYMELGFPFRLVLSRESVPMIPCAQLPMTPSPVAAIT